MSSRVHYNIENRQLGVRKRNCRVTFDSSGFVTSCTGSLTLVQSGTIKSDGTQQYTSASQYFLYARTSGSSETNDAYYTFLNMTSGLIISGAVGLPGNANMAYGFFQVSEENVQGYNAGGTSGQIASLEIPTGSICVNFITASTGARAVAFAGPGTTANPSCPPGAYFEVTYHNTRNLQKLGNK